MTIKTAQGVLQVHQIQEERGYVKIKLNQVELGNETDIILHIINPKELEQVLNQLEVNIKYLKVEDEKALIPEIKLIKTKLRAIQKPLRQKRGLLNIVGSGSKWLFGTMDDNDRQDIMERLRNLEENNHATIPTINQQIKINDHFNKTIFELKTVIENDRTKILEAINTTNKNMKELNYKVLFLDQETKLRYLENKINQILDNIMATKNNIIHPSMLTLKELESYQIDFHKLKLLRAGVTEYKDQLLVFAVKIPRNYIIAELQMIKAVPNAEKFEINEQDEFIIVIKGKSYKYQNNMLISDLKLSNNCIFDNKCTLIYNNVTSVEKIDEDTILAKNLYNDVIWQNCDKRRINVTGNYLISFNNCSVGIRNKKFYNRKITILDKYIYPGTDIKPNYVKPINFDKIIIENVKNIKEIQELKLHRNIMYGGNGIVTVLLVVSLLGMLIHKLRKNKNGKIKIINNMKPEASYSKRGGVIHVPTQRDATPVIHVPTQHDAMPTPDDTLNIPGKSKPMAW